MIVALHFHCSATEVAPKGFAERPPAGPPFLPA